MSRTSPASPTAIAASDATNASRDAAEIHACVGDPAALGADAARRHNVGRHLVFTLTRDKEQLHLVAHHGVARDVPLPWRIDNRFGIAWMAWQKLTEKPDPRLTRNATAMLERLRTAPDSDTPPPAAD